MRNTATLTDRDIVGRYGGEEFVVILLKRERDYILALFDQILYRIKTHCFEISDDIAVHITVSIGVSTVEPEDSCAFSVIDRADKALYRAKQQGRDQIVHVEQRSGQDRRSE